MENATKALLIAAAVLVAIIIISITLVIVNQGQEAASGADLSELEAAEFNSTFLSYEKGNVSTTQVNALLNTVFQHNKQELASGKARYVSITVSDGTTTAATISDGSGTTVPSISGSNYYTVQCNYTGTIITSITVTKK